MMVFMMIFMMILMTMAIMVIGVIVLWPTILIAHCPRPDPDQTTIRLIILIFEEDCDDREEEIIEKRMMTMQL